MKSLLSNRTTNQQTGFNLTELLIVLAIIGLLLAQVRPFDVDSISPKEATLVKIVNLEMALDIYRLDIYEYPKTLEALIKNETNEPRWQGPYLRKGLPKDMWGNPFQYQIPGRHGNDYDLFSYGADRKIGGGRGRSRCWKLATQ